MAFIMLYFKKLRDNLAIVVIFVVSMALFVPALASDSVKNFQAQLTNEGVTISAQFDFVPGQSVMEALDRGVPIVFSLHTRLYQKRWYWYDKLEKEYFRYYKVTYQPLTRRWQLTTTDRESRNDDSDRLDDGVIGIKQYFSSFNQILVVMRHVHGLLITPVATIQINDRYRIELSFLLDIEQLPRPFRVGTIGKSDWNLRVQADTEITRMEPK
jgi:Domain of unknown function (DUF4390)